MSKNITDQTPCNFEIIYGSQKLINTSLELFSETKERLDCCLDSRGLTYFIESEPLWNAITGLKNKKNITPRLATEITPKNIRDCNLIMKYIEVFHNDRLKGNFFIVDGIKYLYYIIIDDDNDDDNGNDDDNEEHDDDHEGKQSVKQLFFTEAKPFIETQQYLFDNLCSHSIPAKEKIREIGRDIKGDFVDIIQTPSETQKIATELMESATYEILLLFPTTNSFYRAEYNGFLNSLWEASQRGVTVKILIQGTDQDDKLKEIVQRAIIQKNLPVNFQYMAKPLETTISTLVIDQAVSLAVHVIDDTKKTFEESIGIAIYSNNESKVSSSITIFETLWIQSEIDKENKVRQAFFQMFKGFELREEFYSRRWSSEQLHRKKDIEK